MDAKLNDAFVGGHERIVESSGCPNDRDGLSQPMHAEFVRNAALRSLRYC
jgi:hypothetical protein